MNKIGLVIVGAAMLFSSCATLFTGTSDMISIDSSPVGAKILIDGLNVGKTPATIKVERSFNTRQVTLKLTGYENRVFILQREFNTVAILNMLGLVGWAVDVVTGSIYRYSPKNYDIELDAVVSYNMDDLKRDQLGRYIVPDLAAVQIIDNHQGFIIAFVQ